MRLILRFWCSKYNCASQTNPIKEHYTMNKVEKFFKNFYKSLVESQRLRAEYTLRTYGGTQPLSDKDREALFKH